MRFRSLSQNCVQARRRGFAQGTALALGTSLCAGALLAGPLAAPLQAAPTLGGDENGPQVQILQPGYQDVLKGKTKILIAVKAQKFNPQFVEMFIDDKPATQAPIPIASLPSAQYDWPTNQYPDGPHKLTVRVTDTQGFRGWAEVNVYINNQKKIDALPPSLEWMNVDSLQQLSGTAQLQMQAVDNFGVKWIIVSINPASDPARKPALRSWLLNRPPYVIKFDTTAVPDGLYAMTAKAWDSFEQEGSAKPLTIGVVNNAVNATTIGQMLAGMAQMNATVKPTSTSVKPGQKFTLDAPSDSTSTAVATPKSPAVASTTKATSLKPAVVKSNPGKSVSSSTANPVAPASPKNVEVARNDQSVSDLTQAQLSNPSQSAGVVTRFAPSTSVASSASAKSTSPLSDEIGGALHDDWRTRLARADAPALAARGPVAAQLSSPTSGDMQRSTGTKSAANPSGEATRFASARSAAPSAKSRPLEGANAAQLSAEGDRDVTNATKGSPLTIEAQSKAHSGRVSNPGPLLASASPLAAAALATPTMSEGPARTQTQVARVKSAAVGAVASAPTVGKVSAPTQKVDARRFAALPRRHQEFRAGDITAITVSPLEVKTSDAIPAFHHVARTTDVRAVAARYGLPVDVVAACNNWPTNMTLVAGTNVKLPQQLKVAYQGVPVHTDAPSMLVGGTGVTAFRFLFEKQGGSLVWNAKKQTVVATKGNSKVVLTIGSKSAKVGDKDVMMELAAFLFEGRTMVPVRFFEQGLNAKVEWDPQTGRLVVAMAG